MSTNNPFAGIVQFMNDLLTPTSLYNIQLPQGLDIMPFPIFLPAAELFQRCPNRSMGTHVDVVGGCVKSELSVEFEDINRQWRIERGRRNRRTFIQGSIFLNLRLTLYLREDYDPSVNPPYGRQYFQVVMEHEALHVLDETDIINIWLPRNITGNVRYVREHLINRQPVDEGMFRHWYIGNGLTREIQQLWARERNARHHRRDNPQAYASYRRRIRAINIRSTNDPR